MNEIEYGNKVINYYEVHGFLDGLLKSSVEASGTARGRVTGKEIQNMCDDAVLLKVGTEQFRDPDFRRMYDAEDIYESMKEVVEVQRGSMLISTLSLLRRLDILSCQELGTPSGELFIKTWQSWGNPEVNLAARVQAAFSCLYSFDPHQMGEVEWRDVRGYLLHEATKR